ncbi:hypothetical protein RRG08_041912 [Elysia crispata]|uniref:Uncharacterized protein n=1 Tax=Elysia crispata TaxID=231223 RepID=A0AAE1CNM4_9GAST|nr:hypothetical protein RRG08_041912 [Elysia crispata]
MYQETRNLAFGRRSEAETMEPLMATLSREVRIKPQVMVTLCFAVHTAFVPSRDFRYEKQSTCYSLGLVKERHN